MAGPTGQKASGQATQVAPASKQPKVRVRAIRLGFYDNKRRREGDVFTLRRPEEFSEAWMEQVSAQTPEHTTSAIEDLRRQQAEMRSQRFSDRSDRLEVLGSDGPTGDANPLDA